MMTSTSQEPSPKASAEGSPRHSPSTPPSPTGTATPSSTSSQASWVNVDAGDTKRDSGDDLLQFDTGDEHGQLTQMDMSQLVEEALGEEPQDTAPSSQSSSQGSIPAAWHLAINSISGDVSPSDTGTPQEHSLCASPDRSVPGTPPRRLHSPAASISGASDSDADVPAPRIPYTVATTPAASGRDSTPIFIATVAGMAIGAMVMNWWMRKKFVPLYRLRNKEKELMRLQTLFQHFLKIPIVVKMAGGGRSFSL